MPRTEADGRNHSRGRDAGREAEQGRTRERRCWLRTVAGLGVAAETKTIWQIAGCELINFCSFLSKGYHFLFSFVPKFMERIHTKGKSRRFSYGGHVIMNPSVGKQTQTPLNGNHARTLHKLRFDRNQSTSVADRSFLHPHASGMHPNSLGYVDLGLFWSRSRSVHRFRSTELPVPASRIHASSWLLVLG
jgi:hypothetical protein